MGIKFANGITIEIDDDSVIQWSSENDIVTVIVKDGEQFKEYVFDLKNKISKLNDSWYPEK